MLFIALMPIARTVKFVDIKLHLVSCVWCDKLDVKLNQIFKYEIMRAVHSELLRCLVNTIILGMSI